MVARMDECRVPRALAALDVLFEFVDGFAARESVPATTANDIRLAIEELFTNSVKYHPESTEDILVRLEREGSRIRATLQDFDVEPWDITKPPFDPNVPPDMDTPGGRGLYLVRHVTDELHYDYRDRCSTITFTKQVDA